MGAISAAAQRQRGPGLFLPCVMDLMDLRQQRQNNVMIRRHGVLSVRFPTTQNACLFPHAGGVPRPSFNRTITKEPFSVKRRGRLVIHRTVHAKTNAYQCAVFEQTEFLLIVIAIASQCPFSMNLLHFYLLNSPIFKILPFICSLCYNKLLSYCNNFLDSVLISIGCKRRRAYGYSRTEILYQRGRMSEFYPRS